MINKQNFPKTSQTVQELQAAIKELKQVFESKKNAFLQQKQAYKRNMAEKNAQLEMFSKTTADAVAMIDRAVEQIDKVMDENGTSNNHN